jgi:hypothetical protein
MKIAQRILYDNILTYRWLNIQLSETLSELNLQLYGGERPN